MQSSMSISRFISVGLLFGLSAAQAQDSEAIDEISVIGSYLKKASQFDLVSPTDRISQDDLYDMGTVTFEDVINNLTINSGTFNRQDTFNNTFATGTGNVNLRGLGASSTLVLINGHRTVRSASFGNTGENFTDINSLVPIIAVEDIEILKDGASALYGTDAVAGVMNFKTRNDFRGVELNADYQTVKDGNQDEYTVSGIFGTGNDNSNFVAAFSYLDRTGLASSERSEQYLSARRAFGTTLTIFANPGTFGLFPSTGAFTSMGLPTATGPTPEVAAAHAQAVVDILAAGGNPFVPLTFASPNCAAVAAVDPTFIQGTHNPVTLEGVCMSDFGGNFSIVPDEKRTQVFLRYGVDISDETEWFIEGGYSSNEAEVILPASEPLLNAPLIPSFHPDNPFGVDALWLGRPADHMAPATGEQFENDTWRIHTGIVGDIGTDWDYDLSVTIAQNNYDFSDTSDLKIDRVSAALFGAGGPNNDQFYNPFILATENDPAVLADLFADYSSDAEAKTTITDAVFTNPTLFEAGGRDIGVALGLQYRDESLEAVYSDDATNNNLSFFIGNQNFSGDQDAFAGFVEVAVPVSDSVELQLAVRYEDLGTEDTTNPKVGFLWTPSEQVSVRGTYGTAFRAPSLFQVFGSTNAPLRLPGTPSTVSQFTAQDPSNPLRPEEADVFNIGFSWAASDKLDFSLDYWDFAYEDVIFVQSPVSVVDADPNGPQVVRNAFGIITNVTTFFSNAPALDTNGFDISVNYAHEMNSGGTFLANLSATRVIDYNLVDPFVGAIDGIGKRNFENFGSPAPEWRANLTLGWAAGNHQLKSFVHYIDSYSDNRPFANAAPFDGRPVEIPISSYTAVDLQYRYEFSQWSNSPILTIGSNNIFNEFAPPVSSRSGFDTAVHDARGALYYVRLGVSFGDDS